MSFQTCPKNSPAFERAVPEQELEWERAAVKLPDEVFSPNHSGEAALKAAVLPLAAAVQLFPIHLGGAAPAAAAHLFAAAVNPSPNHSGEVALQEVLPEASVRPAASAGVLQLPCSAVCQRH